MELVVNKIAKPIVSSSLEKVKNTGTNVVEKITAEPVKKKVATVADKMIFAQYMFAKDLALKTTNDEIKNLFKLEGDEFLMGAYNFLLKKMGVPESLRPQIASVPQNEKIGMAYNFISNQLWLNPNYTSSGKTETYGLLRHEFQHLLQNLDILRNLEIRENVITAYAKKAIEMDSLGIDYRVRNYSLDQIKAEGFSDEGLKLYADLKTLLQEQGEEKYLQKLKELSEESLPDYKKHYEEFSDLIIKEMGPLKPGSREANRSVKFFNEIFKDSNYYKADGSVHVGKYVNDIRENEALISQDVAISDVKALLDNEKSCYFQKIKASAKGLKEQVDNKVKDAEEIVETSKQMAEEFSAKEYIDYLFN